MFRRDLAATSGVSRHRTTADRRCPVRPVLALVLVAAVSCRSAPPPELPLSSTVTAADRQDVDSGPAGCGGVVADADLSTVQGRSELIGAAVDAVRAGQCGPIDPLARVCRGLFLIAATDPLAAIGAGIAAEQFDQLLERHEWALAEGIDAAQAVGDAALADALRRLAGMVSDGTDRSLADAAIARAAPDIVEPIAEAEARCEDLADRGR